MKERMDYFAVNGAAMKGMLELEKHVHQSGIDKKIIELVKTRASQLNGCAYCLDMHTKDARLAGETEQRIYALSAWRDAPFYTEKERVALEWTEALTQINHLPISDKLYDRVRSQFEEKELVSLTTAIVAINGWNRLSKAFGTVAGTYEPEK